MGMHFFVVQSIQWCWNDLTSLRSAHHPFFVVLLIRIRRAINSNCNQINGIALLFYKENDFSNLFRPNNNRIRREIESILLTTTGHGEFSKFAEASQTNRTHANNPNNPRTNTREWYIMIWMRVELNSFGVAAHYLLKGFSHFLFPFHF